MLWTLTWCSGPTEELMIHPHSHEPLPWPLSLSLTFKNLFRCDYKALLFSISVSVSLTDKLLPTIVLFNSFWRKELFLRRSLEFSFSLKASIQIFHIFLPISTQNKIVVQIFLSRLFILNAYCNNNIPYIYTHTYILLFLAIFSICQILINPYVP